MAGTDFERTVEWRVDPASTLFLTLQPVIGQGAAVGCSVLAAVQTTSGGRVCSNMIVLATFFDGRVVTRRFKDREAGVRYVTRVLAWVSHLELRYLGLVSAGSG